MFRENVVTPLKMQKNFCIFVIQVERYEEISGKKLVEMFETGKQHMIKSHFLVIQKSSTTHISFKFKTISLYFLILKRSMSNFMQNVGF